MFSEPLTVSFDVDYPAVVREAIENRGCNHLFADELLQISDYLSIGYLNRLSSFFLVALRMLFLNDVLLLR